MFSSTYLFPEYSNRNNYRKDDKEVYTIELHIARRNESIYSLIGCLPRVRAMLKGIQGLDEKDVEREGSHVFLSIFCGISVEL